MKAQNIIAQGTASQVYARLVLSAMQRQVVYLSDLTPICYGIHFTKLNDTHLEAMNGLIEALTVMDYQANRLPLTALLVSRFQGKYVPPKSFFQIANRVYGRNWNADNWDQLLASVLNQYTVQDWTVTTAQEALDTVEKYRELAVKR